jgi:hypothetical protein
MLLSSCTMLLLCATLPPSATTHAACAMTNMAVRSAATMQVMLPLRVGVIVARLGVLMSLLECCMMVQTLYGILLLGGA